jgi:hypothetical protein
MSSRLQFRPAGDQDVVSATAADFGLAFRTRLGGHNTAYHTPDGMLLAYGSGVPPDSSRKDVDVLDVAPSLLVNVLGVEPAASMQGAPSLFG